MQTKDINNPWPAMKIVRMDKLYKVIYYMLYPWMSCIRMAKHSQFLVRHYRSAESKYWPKKTKLRMKMKLNSIS